MLKLKNGQGEVTKAGTEKGTEEKGPINKSETASDATSMWGTVRIRLFNNLTISVRQFPTIKRNKIRTYPPNIQNGLDLAFSPMTFLPGGSLWNPLFVVPTLS